MGTRSLGDFAIANPATKTGSDAWITTIPEWPEILEAWQTGKVSQSQIRRWLVEERGYSTDIATRNKVAHMARQYPRGRRA